MAGILGLGLLLGSLPAAAADRLRVAHSTLTATNAVLWVARDRGLFQRHGLQVHLIYVAGVRSLQAYVEAVRVFKQEREFTIGVLGRAMRTTDREILDDTYSFYRDYFEDVPYPTLEGVQLILDELAPRTPRAREARPPDFVDLRFVQALDPARGKKAP
ncbi:MAG: hypothetical protein HYV08_04820 [Deltaproteobacteria bacterium]|nr:hypothetical protein [Deltaproteobacteria bacterium]MBI3077603.1 hypothetical protein [Deltaproteobacteria bacterium]